MLDPARTVAELHTLQQLTEDRQGARRVAFTLPWDAARAFLLQKLAELPYRWRRWATSGPLFRGHLGSLPNGRLARWVPERGRGAEGAAADSRAGRGVTPGTVHLVDWADEEGRFGHSLYASSALSGHLDPERAGALTDRGGIPMRERLSPPFSCPAFMPGDVDAQVRGSAREVAAAGGKRCNAC